MFLRICASVLIVTIVAIAVASVANKMIGASAQKLEGAGPTSQPRTQLSTFDRIFGSFHNSNHDRPAYFSCNGNFRRDEQRNSQ